MSKTQIVTGGIADDAVSEEHLDATAITGSTELAASPADTDEILISDAGTLKRIDYSYIKSAAGSEYIEAFIAGGDQTITHDTVTKLAFDTEELDSGTLYDKDTNYRLTIANAGVYLIGYDINFGTSANKLDNCYVYPYLNGSLMDLGSNEEPSHGFRAQSNPITQISMSSTFIYSFSASDYLEIYANVGHADGGSNTFSISRYYTNWWAIRIT